MIVINLIIIVINLIIIVINLIIIVIVIIIIIQFQVIAGFTSAAAITIASSQVDNCIKLITKIRTT